MKKILLTLFISNILVVLSLSGQNTTAGSLGINYQAVARDAAGKLLANTPVEVQIAFTSKDGVKQQFYSERHQLMTDDLGLLNLVVGEGQVMAGAFDAIPWATEQIWFDVSVKSATNQAFGLTSSTRINAVPYAFHAENAGELVNEETSVEKNQSIRWTTSGNSLTSPATHFVGTRDNQNLVLKTNNQTRAIITKEGQLQIYSGVTGADDNVNNYPLTVEGSKQGIYIKVTGSRDNDNNFVNFADGAADDWGRIEGETFPELEQTWEYQLKVALFALKGASLIAQAVAVGVEAAGLYAAGTGAAASLIFAFAAPGFYAAAVAATAAAVVIGVETAALLAESITWATKIREEIGVTYDSGRADYAEWLERRPGERDMTYGEIVGVKGGQVSLNTSDADHFMVVSLQPIVLGNAPQPGEEKNYEKIAFMGQVPVKVVGKVNAGDYILPSGNNDGMGIAVNPGNMKITDFARIVGVAWESAPESPVNMVRIGIGLNSNGLAPKVQDISDKVDNIIAYLEGKEPLKGSALAQGNQPAPEHKLYSDAEFDKMIDSQSDYLKQFYSDLKNQLDAQGAKLPDEPGLQALFNDPVTAIKKLRRDPLLESHWAKVDHLIQQSNSNR